MNVCGRCGSRIGVKAPRVYINRLLLCGDCVYRVEHLGEPTDSEELRAQRNRLDRERAQRSEFFSRR